MVIYNRKVFSIIMIELLRDIRLQNKVIINKVRHAYLFIHLKYHILNLEALQALLSVL
ncbi:hypothetical protein D3C86_1875470 [compost metagenome]